jgi:Fe-S-cluster containining protein
MGLTNMTICGNCSNCGECCSDFLHLDEREITAIDKYLKKHNILQQNKGANNWNCCFRNETFKRCDIYEVRPQICRVFKCDITPAEAYRRRDEINGNKKARSMAQLFFKDDSKIHLANEYGIKVYKRGEK